MRKAKPVYEKIKNPGHIIPSKDTFKASNKWELADYLKHQIISWWMPQNKAKATEWLTRYEDPDRNMFQKPMMNRVPNENR